ncbi:MAG: thioredoxin domain-containing protein [Acetobacteraceae bacterium]|nr:thioredoxin domain-containing protein [Acetobacteraceae bacterium]
MSMPDNRLGREMSPYLLQHAGNPVHWRAWGPDALAEAAHDRKPILLSVGYAACHWCHVMAHESFEDPETAALMNRLFVNIKVDREERPDIDYLYMSALQGLGEQGGWPLTMFLNPEGAPFWGGTYFPPQPRWGRPSFRQVLQGVADAWHSGQDAVAKNIAALRQLMADQAEATPGGLLTPAQLDAVAAAYRKLNDPDFGGLRGAPKFPNPPIFRFLWQDAFRTGQPDGKAMLHLMLQRMSQGGIYDHLGGGYARYSTDSEWLVPHFEKMLYDNAQLLDLLSLAHADCPNPLYAQCAAETVGWLLRDMTAMPVDGRAAFAASEDADSEGEEGRFYVWTEAEIDKRLGPQAPAFKQAYDVTPAGNWEGQVILRRITPFGTAAEEAALAAARLVLFDVRANRVRPGRDDKVLADWNGLAIAALVRAASVFGQPAWIDRAAEAFAFVEAVMAGPGGRIAHAWRGRISAAGLLDDQACMARAALSLFEATGRDAYLEAALRLVNAADQGFADGLGGYFITASDATDVPLGRPRVTADTATPSGMAVMAEVLARLAHLTGEPDWRNRTEALLRTCSGDPRALSGMPGILAATDLLEEAASVVVAGPEDDPGRHALVAAARASPYPAVVLQQVAGTHTLAVTHPAHGRLARESAVAYLCRRSVCGLPVTDPQVLAQMLRSRSR